MKNFYEKIRKNEEYYTRRWAIEAGYISQEKDCMYEKYNGKFGEGFVFHHANVNFPVLGNSKEYHWVEYIIKRA